MALFENNAWDLVNSKGSIDEWNPNTNKLSWDAQTSPESFTAFGNPGSGTPGTSPMGSLNATVPTAGSTPTAWQQFAGGKDVGAGWGMTALKGLQGIGNFYLGSKQLGLAEDQLKTNKSQFAQQFGIQKQEINRDIRDQGQRRYDRNPELNANPDAYYEENKIK